MRTLDIILYVVAVVCFVLAAVNVSARINLIAAGLLAVVLVPLITLARS